MSEAIIEEQPITVDIEEPLPVPLARKAPFHRNRYFSTDHMNNPIKASKMFRYLANNELLQVSNYYSDRIPEVIEIARLNGIELTKYTPEANDPYYWMRNAYICKKIPIESVEKYKGIHFDPTNLVE